jgi:hypothetical protein
MLAVMTAVSSARGACATAGRCDARRRLSDHANRSILAVVDGHLPIYYPAEEV